MNTPDKPYTGTEGWLQRSACGNHDNPDLWYSTSTADRRMAAHICLTHCPVFVQCDAQRRTSPRSHSVHAAVLYDMRDHPSPVIRQPDPDGVECTLCDPLFQPKPKRVYTRPKRRRTPGDQLCGTAAGVERHRRMKTELCGPCQKQRAAMTLRATAKRNGFPDAESYTAALTTIRRLTAAHYTYAEIGAVLGLTAWKVRNLCQRNDIPAGVPRGGLKPYAERSAA